MYGLWDRMRKEWLRMGENECERLVGGWTEGEAEQMDG